MNVRTTIALAAAALSFCSLIPAASAADEERAYTEGSVISVSYIRTSSSTRSMRSAP